MPRSVKKSRSSQTKETASISQLLGRIVIAVVVVCVVLVFAKAISLASSWRSDGWLGIEPYRLVLLDHQDQAYIVEYIPQPAQTLVVEVPSDLRLQPIGRKSTYTTQGLRSLGDLDGVGEEYLIKAISQEFGMAIDGYIDINQPIHGQTATNIAGKIILHTLIALPSIGSGSHNASDTLKVAVAMRSQRVSIKEIELSDTNVFAEVVEVDGSVIKTLDTIRFDQLIADQRVYQSQVLQEYPIVIENTTNTSGRAANWSRILASQGFDVVRLDDSTEELDHTEVILENQEVKDSISIHVLMRTLDLAKEPTIANTAVYRSPIVVRLGEDS